MRRLPDFFVVGAPKCGTEAMRHYLSAHPEIFMPEFEPHYFGSDLEIERAPLSLDDYAALFARATEPVLGEKSTLYLSSTKAAEEIRAACPGARIVVMLRNPVDMMRSLHNHSVWAGNETITDFAEALAAEPEREVGRTPLPPARARAHFRYRRLASYSGQVERYLEVFGRDSVRIVVQEDFAAHGPATFRSVLEFLGVDPAHTPDLAVVNPAKEVRSRWLGDLMARLNHTVVPALGLGRLPRSVKRPLIRAFEAVRRVNSRPRQTPPLDPALRARLVAEFAAEVDAMSEIVGRDLHEWRR